MPDILSREDAENLVQAELDRNRNPFEEDTPVVVRQSTIERAFGWVVFYQSKEYLETGDPSHMYAGNAPYIVERSTGKLFSTGTFREIEYFIRNFERTGDPFKE